MISFAPPPVSPVAAFPIRIPQAIPNEPNYGLRAGLTVLVIRNETAPLPKPLLPAVTPKVQDYKSLMQLEHALQDLDAMLAGFDGKPAIPPPPPMDGLQAAMAARPRVKHAEVVVHATVEPAAPETTTRWSKKPAVLMSDNHRDELFGTLRKRRKVQAKREVVVAGVAPGKALAAMTLPKPVIKPKPVLERAASQPATNVAPPTPRKWSFAPAAPEKNKGLIAELGERLKLRAQVQLQAVVPGPRESSV